MFIFHIFLCEHCNNITLVCRNQSYDRETFGSNTLGAHASKNGAGRKKNEDSLPREDVKKLTSALKYRENDPGADLRRCYQEGSNSEKREMLQKYLQDKSFKWRCDVIEKTEFKKTDTDRSKYE